MSQSDFVNFARNLWWLSFELLKALHRVLGHASHEEMSNNFEAVFLSEMGFDVMLQLVIQDCEVCRQTSVKMKRKH